MSYVSVDVDIDDVLWFMSSKEKQQLVDDLYVDGYIPTPLVDRHTDDFSNACRKLMGQAWRLTREEEEFIINISKRF
jgi:flagellar motor switch protein FliG